MGKSALVIVAAAMLSGQMLHAQVWKNILIAGAAGYAAGIAVGTKAVSFEGIPSGALGGHEFRSGLVYGTIFGVLSAATAARLTPSETAPPHRFFWDKWNTPLFAGIVAVQTLDYTSTRYFRDRGKTEYLLTDTLVDDKPAFTATEIAAAAGGIGLSYLFHRTGHHKLERVIAGTYIGIGVASAIGNYRYPRTGHDLF